MSDFSGNALNGAGSHGEVTGNGAIKPTSIEELTRQLQAAAAELNAEEEPLAVVTLKDDLLGYGLLQFTIKINEKSIVIEPGGIYHDAVRDWLRKQGYAKRIVGGGVLFVKREGRILSEVTVERMKNALTLHIDSITEGYFFLFDVTPGKATAEYIRETFVRQSHNLFNEKWLQLLAENTDPVLRDTATQMFFPFRNGLVTVTKSGIALTPWSGASGDWCVWERHIIKRDYGVPDGATGNLGQFLINVTANDPQRLNTMRSVIGYLMHHHFRPSEGQAAIFNDEAITDTRNPMGGTGKGLLAQALGEVRTVTKCDGKHLDPDNRFRWERIQPDTQIVWLDDVKPDFDFAMLHSNLTDGWTIERKFKSQFFIPPKDSPKTMICSNSILQGGGTTNKRRQVISELSPHYSRRIKDGPEKTIEEEHGGLFFSDDWDTAEWNRFYGTMLECAKFYLGKGLVPHKGVNVAYNRFRQSVSEDFAEWITAKNPAKNVPHKTTPLYQEFLSYSGADRYAPGQTKFAQYLKSYAEYKGWKYEKKESDGKTSFMLSG